MSSTLTIAHYIQMLAKEYENRPAIYFKSPFRTFCFSYRDIHQQCVRVPNHLCQKGIKKGDRILAWSYNGQEYASILLGCALSGVVAVPIDFSSKADFVALIAEKVGTKHLFHSKREIVSHTDIIHSSIFCKEYKFARKIIYRQPAFCVVFVCSNYNTPVWFGRMDPDLSVIGTVAVMRNRICFHGCHYLEHFRTGGLQKTETAQQKRQHKYYFRTHIDITPARPLFTPSKAFRSKSSRSHKFLSTPESP